MPVYLPLTKIFIFSYGIELLSNVFSFQFEELLSFFVGKFWQYQTPLAFVFLMMLYCHHNSER